MKLPTLVSAAAAALILTACSAHVQTSSGADYLARYSDYEAADGGTMATDTDAAVRQIAAIEPELRFPARIGLARIGSHGDLVSVPAAELAIWSDLAEAQGPEVGEFVPVSPLVASMVSSVQGAGTGRTGAVIDHIRKGAARQHIDYVLVYETGVTRNDKANGLALADLTIVGMFVLPSRGVEVEASASGLLLDVRNGYPYATLTAHAEKKGLTRAINVWSKQQELSATAEEKAVMELADDMREAMDQLVAAAAPAQ
jgi:hypothetical protein